MRPVQVMASWDCVQRPSLIWPASPHHRVRAHRAWPVRMSALTLCVPRANHPLGTKLSKRGRKGFACYRVRVGLGLGCIIQPRFDGRGRLCAAGLAFAAAAGDLRAVAAAQRARPGTTFELVGADFVVDAGLRPWLLEVNAMPSLARKVRCPLVQPCIWLHHWVRMHGLPDWVAVCSPLLALAVPNFMAGLPTLS